LLSSEFSAGLKGWDSVLPQQLLSNGATCSNKPVSTEGPQQLQFLTITVIPVVPIRKRTDKSAVKTGNTTFFILCKYMHITLT
jgi:hypothetical protein